MTHRHVLSSNIIRSSSLSLSGVAQCPGAERRSFSLASPRSKVTSWCLVERAKRPCLGRQEKVRAMKKKEEGKDEPWRTPGGETCRPVKAASWTAQATRGHDSGAAATQNSQSRGNAAQEARRRPFCSAPPPPAAAFPPWPVGAYCRPGETQLTRRPASGRAWRLWTQAQEPATLPDCALRQTAYHASTHRAPVQSGS